MDPRYLSRLADRSPSSPSSSVSATAYDRMVPPSPPPSRKPSPPTAPHNAYHALLFHNASPAPRRPSAPNTPGSPARENQSLASSSASSAASDAGAPASASPSRWAAPPALGQSAFALNLPVRAGGVTAPPRVRSTLFCLYFEAVSRGPKSKSALKSGSVRFSNTLVSDMVEIARRCTATTGIRRTGTDG